MNARDRGGWQRALRDAAPLLALAAVLAGYLCAHVDNGDALLYGRMADRVVATGDLFHLSWTPTQLTDFHDHLPFPVWLVAACRACLGAWGARVVFAGMTLLTWWLLRRWSARHGLGRECWYGLWLVAGTESYLRWQGSPRTDQPAILAMVAAIAVARPGVPWRLALSSVLVGVALLARFPVGVALLALVPAWVLAQRAQAGLPLLRGRDALWLPAFLAGAAALPVAFHLADCALADGQSWPRFLENQVLASLSGARTDGDASRLAPLASLARQFWPGLPFAAAGAISAALVPGQRRRPSLLFCLGWAALLLGGLMLGRRHLPSHDWPAYPALALLGGAGLAALLDRWRGRGWPGLRRALPASLVACAAGFAAFTALTETSAGCEVASAAARLRAEDYCPRLVVASSGGSPDWLLAAKVVDHFDADVAFLGAADELSAPGCAPLIAADSRLKPRPGWACVSAGRRISFYRAEATASR